jgi:hypothetical protein
LGERSGNGNGISSRCYPMQSNDYRPLFGYRGQRFLFFMVLDDDRLGVGMSFYRLVSDNAVINYGVR